MKKIFIAVAICMASIATFSQSAHPRIELHSNGFTGPDSSKNYVVLEYPKITKGDLYKRTLSYLNGIYKNPGKVLSYVEGESISINGYTEEVRGNLDWYRYPINYNINIQFKDGKMRFSPSITDIKEVWSENESPRQYYVRNTDSPNKFEVNCIWIGGGDKDPKYTLLNAALKLNMDRWINLYVSNLSTALSETW